MSSARMNRYIPLVRDFAARVALFHDAVARSLGLHATDVKVLRLLGSGATTAGMLAEQAGLTGAAMTALIDRLERSGYVTRERDAVDRRRVTIRAVPEALRQLDQRYGGLNVAMSKLLATYDERSFAAIADYLAKSTKVLIEQTMKVREENAAEEQGGFLPAKSAQHRDRRSRLPRQRRGAHS